MSTSHANYSVFQDCISEAIVASLETSQTSRTKQSRAHKRAKRSSRKLDKETKVEKENDQEVVSSSEDMADFVEYLATEMWPSLPEHLRTLSYIEGMADISQDYSTSTSDEIEHIAGILPPSIPESLTSYGLPDAENLLAQVLPSYISTITAPPPIWSSTRPEACELCNRDWINLTYHHLIPRSVHDKAIKRGWAEEWELNRVAWLCAACHRCVHRVASNEELAQHWDTVEKLQSREDVQRFAQWVGNVRWKKR